MKEKCKFAIVILVYRNDIDLDECIQSIYKNIKNCKIIIVNAFYDEASKIKIEKIADKYDCDFLNEENKGYSFGNNRGIAYANQHYDYEYIIISNPDIVVKKFDVDIENAEVIAPKIIAASGKNQNPMAIKENKLAGYLVYKGLKKNKKLMFAIGIGLKKIYNKYLMLIGKRNIPMRIYTAHGSFVIIKKTVIDMISPLYDEKMFLFAEEEVLAYKTHKYGFRTVYDNSIVVHHKEDGSMKLADFSINNELRKANIYFYENYILSNKVD